MKHLNTLLAFSLVTLFSSVQAEETKPIPLDYNPAGQETEALKSIPSQDAKVVESAYKDLDQDGIQDKLDHCPNTILHVGVDSKGCELDTDQDGVFDRLDQCPGTEPGVKVNRFGCEGDEDNDGVYDSKDQCPYTPLGASVNKHGCQPKTMTLSNIIFDSFEHTIRPDQVDTLKRDVSVLKELKKGEVVIITGHTDSQSDTSLNERLSWRRANSTKNFFEAQLNFDSGRIYINGKGEIEPIADNNTPEGRQQNRRIEIKILQNSELPSDAVLTIPEEMLAR